MEKSQLIFEINSSRMSAYSYENGQLQLLSAKVCTSRSDSGYKETLAGLLADCGNTDRFESFSCSFSDPKSVLIPMSLFSETTTDDVLALTFHEQIAKGESDYNRIPEWSVVNAYYLPMWVKSVLIMKIPRIVIQHELSHILRFLNTGSVIPLRSYIVIQENHFCLVVRKNGQLVHASYQSYQAPEDILYHLLYTFQHEKIDTKNEIFLYSSEEKLREKGDELIKSASMIEQFSQSGFINKLNDHLLFQLLCV